MILKEANVHDNKHEPNSAGCRPWDDGRKARIFFRIFLHICLAVLLLTAPPSNAVESVHPFVFGSEANLTALLTLRSASSEKALARLKASVSIELAQGDDVTEPYSGCDINQYLNRLTRAGGAANIAANLALYAYLANQGLGYGDPQSAQKARSLASRILLSWAKFSLRDQGAFRATTSNFCSADGSKNLPTRLDVGLQIGRGVPYWVQAEDLLLAQNAFSDEDLGQLDTFLDNIYALMLDASNFWAQQAYTDCERYSNHTSAHLLAMASIARLRQDGRRMAEISAFSPGNLQIPYPLQLEKTIYGRDSTLLDCHENTENPAVSYQIQTVAPGELADRNRAGAKQTFGYPLFSLKELLLGVDLLRKNGIDLTNFTGSHGQSLQLALDYYSYYFTNFMTDKETFIPASENAYPSYSQYVGKQVSWAGAATIEGRDETLDPFVIGYELFPRDKEISAVIKKAYSFGKSAIPLYGVDPIVIEYMVGLPRTSGAQ